MCPELLKYLRERCGAPLEVEEDEEEQDDEVLEGALGELHGFVGQRDVEEQGLRTALAAHASWCTLLTCYGAAGARVGLQGGMLAKFRFGGFKKRELGGVTSLEEVDARHRSKARKGQANAVKKEQAQPSTSAAYGSKYQHHQSTAAASGGATHNLGVGDKSMLHAWLVPAPGYLTKVQDLTGLSEEQVMADFAAGIPNPLRGLNKDKSAPKNLNCAHAAGFQRIVSAAGHTTIAGAEHGNDTTVGTCFNHGVALEGWLAGWGLDKHGEQQLFIVHYPTGHTSRSSKQWMGGPNETWDDMKVEKTGITDDKRVRRERCSLGR